VPLTYISLRAGRSEASRQAICDSVHRAMHETYDVPDDNQFITITEHDAANFRYSTSYLGIERSDELVMIQIAANDTRTPAQKKALFRRMAELLGQNPGLRPEDVFVNLVEVPKENWSLGNGLAQYA
jgi:4-oxalocrotonate tautomerase